MALKTPILVAACIAACSAAAQGPAGVAPSKPEARQGSQVLTGTWDVERVAVDGQDSMHWFVRPDDVTLVGREMVIESGRVRWVGGDTGGSLDCVQAKWRPYVSTWGALLKLGFRRPSGGGRATIATVRDFDLDVTPTTPVSVSRLCEDKAAPAPTTFRALLESEWIAPYAPDRIAVGIQPGSAIIILRRRPESAPIVASFPCTSATTPVEKAICADFSLAAWDRSVAAAFRMSLQRFEDPERLRCAQRAWLKQRDRCGAARSCLEKQMISQLQNLGAMYGPAIPDATICPATKPGPAPSPREGLIHAPPDGSGAHG